MSQIVEQQAIQTLPETSPEPMLPKKDPAHYTKKRHIKRWVILGGVVIVAGLVVLKVMTRPPQLPMMAGTQLTRQTLSSTVNLNGVVESANSAQVYAKVGNMVEQVPVKVGDRVEAGQLLAQLDTTDIQLSIAQQQTQMNQTSKLNQLTEEISQRDYDQLVEDLKNNMDSQVVSAEQALKSAQRELSQARADMNERKDEMAHADEMMYALEKKLSRAKDAYEQAEKDYEKVKNDPNVSEEEKKKLQEAMQQAGEAYDQAVRDWNDGNNEYGGDLSTYSRSYRQARLAYEAALEDRNIAQQNAQRRLEELEETIKKNQLSSDQTADQYGLQKLQKELSDSTITAPISGTVTAVYAKEGAPASGLMFIIEDIDNLVVKTKIKEYDIFTVKEGMSAEIKSDATGNQIFQGQVSTISPSAVKDANGEVKDQGTVEFESDVALTSPESGLRVGMNVRLNIIRDRKENVYAVPLEAIATDENGQSIVYQAVTDEEGNTTAQPIAVTPGLETDFYMEISGETLADGMTILNSAEGLAPGMPIKLSNPAMAAMG